MRRLQSTLLSIGFCVFAAAAMPRQAYAQNYKATLTVCNKGRVTVQAVTAFQTSNVNDLTRGGFAAQHWEIEGTSIAPSACEIVYEGNGLRQRLFLGFGFTDARGRFVSGRVPTLPDFGETKYRDIVTAAVEGATERRALQRLSGRMVCVHSDRTLWGTKDESFPEPTNCAQFQLGNTARQVGTGSFYPLSLTLDFRPGASTCFGSTTGGVYSGGCYGGDNYMNVVANAGTGDVTLRPGTASGADVSPEALKAQAQARETNKKLEDVFWNAAANAYEESEKRKAAEAAANEPLARAEANRRTFEERQNRINYSAEHERNVRRVRDLTEFSPQWLTSNQPLYVRGTVSRVEPSPDGKKPARLYFKESSDGAFVACLSPMWFSNADVNGFVGQRLEVRGRVAQSHCGATVADIQVSVPAMIYDLAKGTPPDEAILPGMKVPAGQDTASARTPNSAASNPAIVPADGAAIPIGTRLRVTLRANVDLLRAQPRDPFQGALATPVTLPDGVIPQGAGVVLITMPPTKAPASPLSLEVYSVSLNGKIWRVSTGSGSPADATANPNVLSPGTTLVFSVKSSEPPVVVRR